MFALKQSVTGVSVKEVRPKIGVSEATFYNWKKKYDGHGTAELRRLRQLEEENLQLTLVGADLTGFLGQVLNQRGNFQKAVKAVDNWMNKDEDNWINNVRIWQ